jgi:hypothetical protein
MHPELKTTAPEIILLRQSLLREAYEYVPQFVTNATVSQKMARVRRLIENAIERRKTHLTEKSHHFALEEQLKALAEYDDKKIKGPDDIERMQEACNECFNRLSADVALSITMDALEADAPGDRIIEGAIEFLSTKENRVTIEAGIANFANNNPTAIRPKDLNHVMQMAIEILRKEVSVKY